MSAKMHIQTAWVPALDSSGRKVSVERQTITVHRDAQAATVGHHYHYDHSHVRVAPDGLLVVLATGEKLRLCGEDTGYAAHPVQMTPT